MLANYTVMLEHSISAKVATFTLIRAESEQDAIEHAKSYLAMPGHWKSYRVFEQD